MTNSPGRCPNEPAFSRDGAERHAGAATPVLDVLTDVLAQCDPDRPGVRLHDMAGLLPLLTADSAIGRFAAARLGPAARPVRAVLFDKTPGTNWALGWHQDRTVAVRARHDLPGWGPWSIKAGIAHV